MSILLRNAFIVGTQVEALRPIGKAVRSPSESSFILAVTTSLGQATYPDRRP
jgi:hypothetical protein